VLSQVLLREHGLLAVDLAELLGEGPRVLGLPQTRAGHQAAQVPVPLIVLGDEHQMRVASVVHRRVGTGGDGLLLRPLHPEVQWAPNAPWARVKRQERVLARKLNGELHADNGLDPVCPGGLVETHGASECIVVRDSQRIHAHLGCAPRELHRLRSAVEQREGGMRMQMNERHDGTSCSPADTADPVGFPPMQRLRGRRSPGERMWAGGVREDLHWALSGKDGRGIGRVLPLQLAP